MSIKKTPRHTCKTEILENVPGAFEKDRWRRAAAQSAVFAAGLFCLPGCTESGGRLPAEIRFLAGPVNGAAITRGGANLVFYGDPNGELESAEKVFFTHHRRDVVWAGRALAAKGAAVVAPAAERAYFDGAAEFWKRFRTERFHDYAQQSTKILAEALPIDEPAVGGRTINWRGIAVETLDTPGYTRGSVSYLVEIGGRKVAFTGDLIYAGGRIFDLYSLQDAIEETETRGYHGYAARAADVLASLRKLAAREPDILIPARGPPIHNPAEAVETLIDRLERLFSAYFQTDALRWYWGGDNLRKRARRVLGERQIDWMPLAVRIRQIPPRWWRKFQTSRLIVSDSGAAFLIDCGSRQVFEDILALQERGGFHTLEGIFVTHFHDDHTDFVQAMAERAQCPVYAGAEVRDILENPAAYHMPAMTHTPIRPVHGLEEGRTLRWREFEFRYTYYPGQAVFHGGLDVRRDNGERFLFIGDSFSPSGLDDYCLLNRHFLHPALGHFRCLDIIEAIEGDYLLVNQHIDESFRYDEEQLTFMRKMLETKRQIIAELVPWDDPNFGTDEQWARFYPYGLTAEPGRPFDLYAVVFNHLDETEAYRITPNMPAGWRSEPASAEIVVESLAENRARFRITPDASFSELAIVTADVAFRGRTLREWIEAMVEPRLP